MQNEKTIAPVRSDEASSTSARLVDRVARRALSALLGRLRAGAVAIEEGGRRSLYGTENGAPVPEITVRSPRVWSASLVNGSVGLGASYVSSWWDVKDGDELTELLRIFTRDLNSKRTGVHALGLFEKAARRLRRPKFEGSSRDLDRANVQAHYDLGNEFFEQFLDETLTYSSAIFEHDNEDLAVAQRRKLDRLCQLLELTADDHVLEIGTGWGSFALHAAEKYGCSVTTTTISARQFDLATTRVNAAGLDDRVRVLASDYRDLEGHFDKIVSIEMIEALDWRQYDTFFSKCASLLSPDGLMALQAIVIADRFYEDAKSRVDFIKAAIFPGSCIPSVKAIVEAATIAGAFSLLFLEDIGTHYARTLREWRHRLEENDEAIAKAGFDEAIRRLFRFYFAYCEAGFAERRISDVQCLFAAPQWRPKLTTPTLA